MELNNKVFGKLPVLLVLVGLTTTVDAHFDPRSFDPRSFDYRSFDARSFDYRSLDARSFDPSSFVTQELNKGDTYFFKSSTSGAFTKATPPQFRHPNIGETNSWKACFCAGSYPPQWQCTDITDFFNEQWRNSILFFKEEIFFLHTSNGGDVPEGIKYFLPGSYKNFP